MNKIIPIIILLVSLLAWHWFQDKSVQATNGSDPPPTNFTGADLTGAILGGVSLDGVILCNTTMPDGTVNNSSCKN